MKETGKTFILASIPLGLAVSLQEISSGSWRTAKSANPFKSTYAFDLTAETIATVDRCAALNLHCGFLRRDYAKQDFALFLRRDHATQGFAFRNYPDGRKREVEREREGGLRGEREKGREGGVERRKARLRGKGGRERGQTERQTERQTD